MRPILVDTNAYAAFMLGDAAVVEVIAHAERICLNSIVLGELLGGFAAGAREAKSRGELARFLDSPRVEVVPVTAQTADSYALVYSGLRRKRPADPEQRPVDRRQRPRAWRRAADAGRALRPCRWAALRSAAGRLPALTKQSAPRPHSRAAGQRYLAADLDGVVLTGARAGDIKHAAPEERLPAPLAVAPTPAPAGALRADRGLRPLVRPRRAANAPARSPPGGGRRG